VRKAKLPTRPGLTEICEAVPGRAEQDAQRVTDIGELFGRPRQHFAGSRQANRICQGYFFKIGGDDAEGDHAGRVFTLLVIGGFFPCVIRGKRIPCDMKAFSDDVRGEGFYQ